MKNSIIAVLLFVFSTISCNTSSKPENMQDTTTTEPTDQSAVGDTPVAADTSRIDSAPSHDTLK
jgi:hypothetical protein